MLRPLLLLGLCATLLRAQDDAALLLQHIMPAGTAFAFTIAVDSKLEFEDPRKNSHMHFELRFEAMPAAALDGTIPVTCTLARLTATVEAPNAHINYDSADPRPAVGPLQKLATLIQAKFVVPVATDGTLGEVTIPEPLALIAKDQLGADFRSLFAAYFVPLPRTPVTIGSTWDLDTMLFGIQPSGVATTVRHKLVSVAEGCATIQCAVDAPKPPARPGVRFEVREATGSIAFDLARGRVQRTDLELLARATRTGGDATASATSHLVISAQREEPATPSTEGRPGR